MSNVINFFTKTAQMSLPFEENSSKQILSYLMEYKANNRESMSLDEHIIMRDLIKFIENNSGVNSCQMIEESKAK